MADPTPKPAGCIICSRPKSPRAVYCKLCKKLIDRKDDRVKVITKLRVQALKDAWDGQCFRCYYSGVRVIEDDPDSPRYLRFEHRTPGDESSVVIASALMNDMKSDMDESEFREAVKQIYGKFFEGSKFDEAVMDLKYWRR